MTTKITVIYDNPLDPAVFEAGYPGQLELAKKLPGLERYESSKIWPKEDGSATPAACASSSPTSKTCRGSGGRRR